jgi:methyl-accepting chemotaxis protein
MLAMTAAAFVIGLLAAVKITRGVTGPVRVAQAAAHRIAGGDLTQPIHVEQHDELGTLLTALEHMRMQLAELTGKVQVSTQQIGAASSEIAAGSRDLSTRTELAAANLQRTAASMDQVKGLVEQNLQAAQQADALAADAMSAAQRGGTVAREAVAHMGELSKAAKRIGEIVGVIERIAAQTNILAINAAVEAARAGEQGRGFSVVAGDVRLLAHQCSQSAKEVKALVDASNGTVDEGSRLVQEAGATMVGIVDAIGGVKALIGRVRASADVQSEGIRSVNAEVTQLDNATQSNAALVEQSAAAADSLKDQADRLVDAVGVFRVDTAA